MMRDEEAHRRIQAIERDARRDRQEDVLIGDGRRLILRSPNGHFWRLTVSDAGVVSAVDMGASIA